MAQKDFASQFPIAQQNPERNWVIDAICNDVVLARNHSAICSLAFETNQFEKATHVEIVTPCDPRGFSQVVRYLKIAPYRPAILTSPRDAFWH
jgi:hypothetical protein